MTIEISGGQQPDEQRDPGAPDQQGQHRAAVVVGAEPVLARRRLEHAAGRLGDLEPVGVGASSGAKTATSDEDGEDRQADHARTGGCGTSRQVRRQASRRRRRASCRAASSDGAPAVVVMCAPAGRGGRRAGWPPGWRRSRRPRRRGRCPAAPSSRGRSSASVREQPEPGDREDRLDRDRPGDDEAEVERDDRGRGQQRVADGVPAAHLDVAQPLGPGGGQVVLAELVEQRRAHDQRVVGEVGQGQRDHRQRRGARRCRARPSSDAGSTSDRVQPAGREDAGERARSRPRRPRSAAARATTPASSRASATCRWRPGRTCLPRFQAPTDADPDADDVARIVEVPTSSSVGHSRSSDQLGDRDRGSAARSPRSPVNGVLQVGQELLRAAAGRARRLVERRRAAPACVNRPRPRVRAGSPGSTRNRKKLTTSDEDQAAERPEHLARRRTGRSRAAGGSSGARGGRRLGVRQPPASTVMASLALVRGRRRRSARTARRRRPRRPATADADQRRCSTRRCWPSRRSAPTRRCVTPSQSPASVGRPEQLW